MPVLAAQSNLRWLSNADDVATFKTMLKIGLPITPTSQLQTPPIIQFALFKAIEPTLPERDAGPFMDAAIEYVEYTRDADDLVSLAIGAKRQNAPLDIVDDYVERAIAAAQGAKAGPTDALPDAEDDRGLSLTHSPSPASLHSDEAMYPSRKKKWKRTLRV